MSSSISDSSARIRSDSTEDSELPVHEHKRPRLSDPKPDESDVMSDLHQEPSNSAPTPAIALAMPDTQVRPTKNGEEGALPKTPPLPPRTMPSPSAISPTSKVTINTRPLSSQSLTQPTQLAEEATMPSHASSTEGPAICVEATKGPEAASVSRTTPAEIPETISISSSPSKSPEIEVAEPEDFDQDPAETRWTQRIGGGQTSVPDPKFVPPGHVNRTFPFSHETTPGNTHRVIPRMSDRLQHAGAQDGQIFRLAKDWMIQFVTMCDVFPLRLLHEERDFWLRLPDLVEGLLRREAGPPPGARTEELVDFFVAFAQITKLLMDYDVQNLHDVADETDSRDLKSLGLMSGNYMQALVWIFSPRVPFQEYLAKSHNLDRGHFHTLVVDRLADPSTVALLPSLSALMAELSGALPKRPDFFRPFHTLLQVTKGMMAPMANMYYTDLTIVPSAFSQLDNIRNGTAEIILQADNAIQHAITKQLAWLNLETAKAVIDTLNPMVSAIGEEIPQIGQDIISSAGVGFADSDLTDLPATMQYAWKFKILRKFITNGRMELRVYGLECMSTDLITVHRLHIDGQPYTPMSHPLVRYLTKFIKENQLVEYIVGVDSHPQLIHRGYNVVGFLCVSKTYTEADTDVIWKTIVDSQDPRTIQEVFNLLRNCFVVYDLAELYYICRKLSEYPFQRFDLTVLHFTVNLFENIKNRSGSSMLEPGFAMDPLPWNLCIRLLREASTEENASFEQAPLIRRDFPQYLSSLLSLAHQGLPPTLNEDGGLNQIFTEAAANLKEHNQNASGDAQILYCLLVLLGRVGAAEALHKFDLLELLVADFAHLRDKLEGMLKRNTSAQSIEAIYEVRSTCLAYFILNIPEAFTADLVQELWISFYALSRLPASVRAMAWDKLSHAAKVKQNKDENAILDLIIERHLPTLVPQDYNQPVMEFIRTSVQYTIRRTPQEPLEAGEVLVVPGIERMFKVMLEAPPNTVENEATDFIIRMYLDNIIVTKQPKAVIDATHSSLVDRSVKQVMASASKLKSYTDGTMSGEDEPMVIIASEDEIRAEELRFDRSLLFLRKFLEGMKLRPRYSPVPDQQAQSLPDFPSKKGESIELNIQIMASKYVTEKIQKVGLGSENTCDELHKYLCEASGFTQFSIFHMGQKVILAGLDTMTAESKLGSGSLIVHKTLNTPDSPPIRSARATSPVDNKIMHHFDDLYDLLDADERLSREVYTFLSLFSAQTELVRIVRSKNRSAAELLPPGRPFKLLYCARALRSCIEDESFSSNPDTDFLIYSIRTIVQVLPKLELSNSSDQLQMSIAHSLMEALLLAFRAKVSVETSQEYIQDHQDFVTQASRLLRFALAGQGTNVDDVSVSAMVKLVLEAFIEACLHDQRVWKHVDADTSFQDLIVMAFVQDPRVEVRHSLLEVVVGMTGAIGTKLHLKINNPRAPRSRFPSSTIEASLSHLWTALSEVLPRACLEPERCAEVCEAILAILRRIGKSFSTEVLLRYFNHWSSILLKHEHVEVVGQLLKDHVIFCLTKLLLECCKPLKAANAIPSGADFIERLISLFLFPPFSDGDEASGLPILDSTVREGLYNLILALCQCPRDLATIVTSLKDDLLPGDFFEPFYSSDRQSLRTDVGYAGLKNLSNTCYLNSLFSQLFMNVEFREFFLNLLDAEGPQSKLVLELAKVFANMQNSYDKAIDPTSAVEAITTYEGEQIDVSIQMDVDEFFNLLFDRIEGQIDSSTRDTFKSMYGGQLVQQVKSKECEHISERLEPFSAVQVEIKGKARLEDSLRAYVEGEVLQGENKYSCTSCGRHVDAVKRACLKDVPDNLIFNLKRFDYDIMTGMRTKVNDEFQFPDTLDMAPYTLARLSDDTQTGEPDYFQLVGVIVHSGTADSGHYYSFIRQRPSIKNVQEAWVQFNDQDVGVFDPSQMSDNCFGGTSETGFYHLPKFYSAYMLFYQRTSSIQKVAQQYRAHDAINPVRISLPPRMERHIAQQNELFLRSYCAQDPAHAQFVLRLLEHMRRGVEKCTDDHILESATIEMGLDYVHNVTSRFKELPSVEETLNVLLGYTIECPGCARTIADWFRKNRVMEDVIVRSPLQAVRKGFSNLFVNVFTRLRELASEDDLVDEDNIKLATEYSAWLKSCLSQLSKLWDVVTRLSRCWIDYFNLIYQIHQLGDSETIWILEEDFLEKFVDMIMMHVTNPEFSLSKRLKSRYPQYLNLRDRNRQFHYQALIMVFASILQKIDLHLPADEGYRQLDTKIGLNTAELQALGLNKLPPDLEWIRRLIVGRHNLPAQDAIITIFAQDRTLSHYLSGLLMHGLNERSINVASTFTRPTVFFCEACPNEKRIRDVAQTALESVYTVGIEYGKEYYELVDGLLKIENVACGTAPLFLEDLVLQTIGQWAPTLLLAPTEGQFNTRVFTVDLLKRILFNPLQTSGIADLERYEVLATSVQELATSCATFVQQNFLNPRSREGANMQPGQVSQVIDLMEHCLQYFESDDDRVLEMQNVMAQLKAKAESAVETMSSADWQDNSSELAELSGEEYDDALSP